MLTAAMLRRRWRDLVATLVALTLGVGISAAALAVSASAQPQVPARFAAADVLVRAPQAGRDADEFPEYLPWSAQSADALADRLRRVPGVEQAVVVRAFYAQLVLDERPAGSPDADDPQGQPWSAASLAPYPLAAGRPPVADDEVAVSADQPVRVGQRVPLLTASGQREAAVTGLVRGPGIYVADARAHDLSGGSRLLAVTAAPDTDVAALAAAVRAEVGPGPSVLTGGARSGAESEGASRTRNLGAQLLSMMLLLACFAAVLVVSQTFALAASHHRRDLALLRALGGTPRQVQAVLLRQVAVVGLVGAVLGAVLGTVAAPALGRLLVRTGLEPVGFEVRTDPLLLALLVLVGPVIAVVATWATGRRASRVPAMEAVRTAQVEDRRLGRLRRAVGALAGLGAVGAGVGAALAEPRQISGLATVATLLAIAALTLLGPLVLPPLLRVLTWPLSRGRGATGMVVRGAMTTATARTTSTIAPVIAMVAFATLVLGYVETGHEAYGGQELPPGTTAVVAPRDTPGLTEDAVARTRAAAGTAAAGLDDALPTQVFTGTATGVAAVGAAGVSAVPAGSAVVNRALAVRDRVEAGGSLQVVLQDGERVTVRVAQVREGGEDPRILLPRPLVREHDGSALTPLLTLAGTPPQQVAPVAGPAVRALAAPEYLRVAGAEEYRLLRMLAFVGLGLALGYTLLSIANTLLMATAARARDLGLLRLSGATPRQVLSGLAWESLLTVVMGSALGLLAGLTGLLGIRSGLAREVERAVPLALPWDMLGVLVAAGTVLAVAAGLWPARGVLRQSPAALTRGGA